MSAQGGNKLGKFRDMTWFHPHRAHVYAVAMAIAMTGIFVKVVWSLHNGYDNAGDLFGGDYSSFWAASRLVLAGKPADVYVPALHRLAETPLNRGYEAFFYPPTYLLFCIPLGLLPFFPSLAVFMGGTGAAFVTTILRILRTPWAIPVTIGFPAVLVNIIPGQNAFLTAAILGTGLTLLERRPKLAGAILGLMIIKPHLVLAVPIALAISKRWAALLCAGSTAFGLVALSYGVLGGTVWAAFLTNSHKARETLEQGLVGFNKMQSAFALARMLGANTAAGYLIQGMVTVVAIGSLLWLRPRRASPAVERSLIVLACLLITPFSLTYDLLLIALPLAWMLREWSCIGFPAWGKVVMLTAFGAPMLFCFVDPLPFGPPILLLLGAHLLWTEAARGKTQAEILPMVAFPPS